MTDRPILFSAPMVRALLEGRKTQTRRICKLKLRSNGSMPAKGSDYIPCLCDFLPPSELMIQDRDGLWQGYCEGGEQLCPYGRPGDRLWVRETWQQFFDDEMPADRPRGPIGTMGCPATPDRKSRAFYRADGDDHPSDQFGAPSWIPPIHMPRWASRITLEITGVRVERLQEISEADAVAEGCHHAKQSRVSVGYYLSYEHLWESIHGPGSWVANPWVWVIEFRRVAP